MTETTNGRAPAVYRALKIAGRFFVIQSRAGHVFELYSETKTLNEAASIAAEMNRMLMGVS